MDEIMYKELKILCGKYCGKGEDCFKEYVSPNAETEIMNYGNKS